MKKNKKTALMAAVLTGAAMLTGCNVGQDDLTTVYGPPQTTQATTAVTGEIQTEYGAPVAESVTTTEKVTAAATTTAYDPSKDEIQDVYGPPVTENKDIEEETVPYSPEMDNVQLVYGPPESFTE